MRRNLIDTLFIFAGISAVLLAFALLLNVMAEEPEAVLTVPLTSSDSDAPALTIPPTPEPKSEPTPEPFDKPTYDPAIPLSEDLQIVLRKACDENGVDLCIALGLIEVESDFQMDADNGLCYGLMQLNRRYFPNNLPPGENIIHGVEYLGQLLASYDAVESALCAYNAGRDTGSRAFANAVLSAAEKWKEIV